MIKAIKGLLGVVLLASLANADEQAPAAGDRRIQAGPVTWQNGANPQVSGTFRVFAAATDIESPDPALQGGACLVADLTPFGIGSAECATNADCNPVNTADTQPSPHVSEFVGYCAARDGSGETPRCWTRPGPPSTHCKRTIDPFRLTEGEHELGPVSANPLGNAPPYPEWVVYACLAAPGHDRACGEAVSPHRQISLTSLGPGHQPGTAPGQPVVISADSLPRR